MPSRPQSHQSIDFGSLIRGIKVEMNPASAPWPVVAALE
jgi:hypothetical protein